MADINSTLALNGIHASTGKPLRQVADVDDLVRLALDQSWNPLHVSELRSKQEHAKEEGLGPKYGVAADKLEEAGWGVIFAHPVDEAVREALKPLLAHRQGQAGEYYRELVYEPGESKSNFLARFGMGPGPADPAKVPYYLLVVGSPDSIPFDFQYELDVQYAVGRLDFDTPEEYHRYAETVVAAEEGEPLRDRRAVFFAVANHGDDATRRSRDDLVLPLADILCGSGGGWSCERAVTEAATKDRLADFLGGDQTPAFLLTASHGVGFDSGDALQYAHQGALLCQDWPGPRRWDKAVPPDFYFSADDLSDSADVAGLIAFFFACYGAGTPRYDSFSRGDGEPPELAPRDFVAGLPRRLLAHPGGGALAVVGHVDQAWTYSFDWLGAGPQLQAFESTLLQLLDGDPLGLAMEYFNLRFAELATSVTQMIQMKKHGYETDHLSLAGTWTANNDARSFVVLGDPAVRVSAPGPAAAGKSEVSNA